MRFILSSSSYALCFIALATVSLLFSSCKEESKLQPALQAFAPPITERSSILNIPLAFEIQKLEQEINQAVGQVILDDDSFDGDNLKMKISRLTNIEIGFLKDQINLVVPLKIDCEGRLKKNILGFKVDKTQKASFSVKLHLSSKVDIDANWDLITNTKLNRLEWVEKPKVQFALISIPVDKLIEKQLDKRKTKLLRELDELARKQIDLRSPIAQVYNNIQNPILLSRELGNVWLKVQPQRVSLGKLKRDAKRLRVDAAIEASINTFVQEHSPKSKKFPLPNKSKSSHPSGLIDLNILGELKFAEVNKVLEQELLGKEFEIKKRKIRIDSIRSFGSGEMLMLKAQLSGDLEGEVFLNGKPGYDPKKRELFVEDFDFELKSRAFILKAADWLYHDNFLRQIQDLLRVPLSNEISQIPQLINKAIEQGELKDKIALDIKHMDFSAEEIRVQEQGVQTLIKVKGEAGMEIRSLSR